MWWLNVPFAIISQKMFLFEHLQWLIWAINIIEIYWYIFSQPHMKRNIDKRIHALFFTCDSTFHNFVNTPEFIAA